MQTFDASLSSIEISHRDPMKIHRQSMNAEYYQSRRLGLVRLGAELEQEKIMVLIQLRKESFRPLAVLHQK